MPLLLRHLIAVLALPFTMAVVIPLWLAGREATVLAPGRSAPQLAVQTLGVGLLAVGLLLFGASFRRFATEGEGTLAPWDPPRRLVVRGPYRYVRNPMISGVALVLLGEAAVLLSRSHLAWALIFLGINAVYIPLLEEPFLAERFGDTYRDYCRHVPRLVPRWRPWEPERGGLSPSPPI
jgi:protein-S-isoprenylcysteine O-methyltransferase Ste14